MLERLLGGGAGGSFLRCQEERSAEEAAFPHPPPPPVAAALPVVEESRDLLICLGLGEEEALARSVSSNFARIYGKRRPRPGFRKTERKRRAALAFSLHNTLARGGAPRPVDDILALCQVEAADRKAVLDIGRYLNFGAEEYRSLPESDYTYQEAEPDHYVDVVSAKLGLPFHVASLAHEKLSEIRAELHGRKPLTVTASALALALTEKGLYDPRLERALSLTARCQPRTIRAAIASWRRLQAAR